MSIDSNSFLNTDNVAFPLNAAVNATGPSTTDGTEFVKLMIDNYLFGPMQAILDRAGLTPNGVTEVAGNSQFLDSLNLMCCAPGVGTEWSLALDPATTGHRCLLRQGQGILIANYPDLVSAVYVGDGNNATVAAGGGAFYKADDAAGTIPNIAGTYLILDSYIGVTDRGLDPAASIDPDGAARFLGDIQADAMQRITGGLGDVAVTQVGSIQNGVFSNSITAGANAPNLGVSGRIQDVQFSNATSTFPNASKTDEIETRMYNRSVKKVIWY